MATKSASCKELEGPKNVGSSTSQRVQGTSPQLPVTAMTTMTTERNPSVQLLWVLLGPPGSWLGLLAQVPSSSWLLARAPSHQASRGGCHIAAPLSAHHPAHPAGRSKTDAPTVPQTPINRQALPRSPGSLCCIAGNLPTIRQSRSRPR